MSGPTIELSSKGILEYTTILHGQVGRMDLDVTSDTKSKTGVLGQGFIGVWTDYMNSSPFSEDPKPRGLIDLLADIRKPTHVVNETADFQRLRRFQIRMIELWDMGAAAGLKWTEPKPELAEPGVVKDKLDDLIDAGVKVAIVGAVTYVLYKIITDD